MADSAHQPASSQIESSSTNPVPSAVAVLRRKADPPATVYAPNGPLLGSKELPLGKPRRRPVPERGEYGRNAEYREFIASSCGRKPVYSSLEDMPGGPFMEAAAAQVKSQDLIATFTGREPKTQEFIREPAPALALTPSAVGIGGSAQPAFSQIPQPALTPILAVPDLDQEAYYRNPEYREYVGGYISGQFLGTFDEYKKERMLRAVRAPLEYMHVPVIYTGDGAGYINSVNQMNVSLANSRIYAHNKALHGPGAGEIACWSLRSPQNAIYKQALADHGVSRAEFDRVVATIEQIRTSTKKEKDKKNIVSAAALGTVTFGVGFMGLIHGIHKKSVHSVPTIVAYLSQVNTDLRQRQIPIVWHCKLVPIMLANYEITVTHSPL